MQDYIYKNVIYLINKLYRVTRARLDQARELEVELELGSSSSLIYSPTDLHHFTYLVTLGSRAIEWECSTRYHD